VPLLDGNKRFEREQEGCKPTPEHMTKRRQPLTMVLPDTQIIDGDVCSKVSDGSAHAAISRSGNAADARLAGSAATAALLRSGTAALNRGLARTQES
jgi:hypothetical protein